MILVSGGDSFIWGSELADCPHGGPNGYSMQTFPALLSTSSAVSLQALVSTDRYVCTAYPGIGNNEIHDRVIKAVTQDTSAVMVCWTWQARDNDIDSDHWILSLQKHLVDLAIPYVFTCVDNCIITNNPAIDYDSWFMFPSGTVMPDRPISSQTTTPRGFYQWAVENKYSIGPDSHPLEQAHQDAADLIKERFDAMVKKNLQTYQVRNILSKKVKGS